LLKIETLQRFKKLGNLTYNKQFLPLLYRSSESYQPTMPVMEINLTYLAELYKVNGQGCGMAIANHGYVIILAQRADCFI